MCYRKTYTKNKSFFRSKLLTIWADADSLTSHVRTILLKRSGKRVPNSTPDGNNSIIKVVFVSCKVLPEYKTIDSNLYCIVEQKAQSADEYILSHANYGDIVITRDILFAEKALQHNLFVLNDRGTIWTHESIRERLAHMEYVQTLRDAGIASSTIKTGFSKQDIKAFADALDKTISAAYKYSNTRP